jgi:hypothetical protein
VLWAGRGVSAALSAGARLTWRPVTAVLDPTVYYTENRAFDLAPDTGRGINRGGLWRWTATTPAGAWGFPSSGSGVSASFAVSRELNRNFEVLDDFTNAMLDLRVAWRWR